MKLIYFFFISDPWLGVSFVLDCTTRTLFEIAMKICKDGSLKSQEQMTTIATRPNLSTAFPQNIALFLLFN